MTTKESLVTKVKLSELIKTDATVDMNSIVAYFISKYENNLFASKKSLSERITKLNSYLAKEFVTEVEADIKLDSFKGIKIKLLNVTTEATLQINPSALENNKVVNVYITNIERSSGNRNSDTNGYISITRAIKVSDELHAKYISVVNEVAELRSALQGVLEQLNGVSRKEREIRGTLAEKTLTESGVGYLFEDEALLNLVTIPQLAMKTVS